VSIVKRAFIQGLQKSLVSARAIPPYSSKWQAKHAMDQAEEKLEEREEEKKDIAKENNLPEPKEKDPEEMSEEDVSEIMTDIVEAEPLDEAIEALQEYQEAAGDSEEASDELAEALEDVKDSKEAALAIRRLKFAGNATGGGPVGDEMGPVIGKRVADFETGYGDPALNPIKNVSQAPFADLVAKSTENNSAHFAEFDRKGVQTPPTKKQVKNAMAILRKLAGEDASAIGGAGQSDFELGKGPASPNPVTHLDMLAQQMDVMPLDPNEDLEGHNGQTVLAHLVAKTAQEVGHFLPQELSSSDKLAALRTMVGMNGQERASYIGRIKQAMYDPQGQANSQDRQAAQVLRNLGL
jgi:hypothetical protein